MAMLHKYEEGKLCQFCEHQNCKHADDQLERCNEDHATVVRLMWESRRASFLEGFGWAIAIVGMFQAIARTYPWCKVVERVYWTSERNGTRYYDCPCPGCGVSLTHMTPGRDEGTRYEWCGSCRD